MTSDDDRLADLPPATPAPRCESTGGHEGHYPMWVKAPKMDSPELKTGACSCGWRSTGLASNQQQALKISREHADAKNATLGLVRISVYVTNRYEHYGTINCEFHDELITLPPERDTEQYEEWQQQEIIDRFTGVGYTDGDSWYDVTIIASSVPALVGTTYDFGY
jgi:hypothetical protein